MRLISLILALCLTSVIAVAQFAQPMLMSGQRPAQTSIPAGVTITSVAPNSGSFNPGTTSSIAQMQATLSNGGIFSGGWSMVTTGTATNPGGAVCVDNSAAFTVSSAGLLSSTAASLNQTYSVCIGASQSGLNPPNPYVQLVNLTPNPTGTVACDVGPPYQGSIPAPAQTLGLTACINFDFTYTGNFSNTKTFISLVDGVTIVQPGQTWNWANFSTWLDASGATAANAIFHLPGGYDVPNSMQLVSDGGKQALLLQQAPTNGYPNALQMNSFYYPDTNEFVEMVARISSTANQNINQNCNVSGTIYAFCAYNGEVIDDFAFWDSLQGNHGGLEVDGPLGCGDANNSIPWNGAGLNSPCAMGTILWEATGAHGQYIYSPQAGLSVTDGNYHQFGYVVSASKSNNFITYCSYYDRTEAVAGQGCLRVQSQQTGQAVCSSTPHACVQLGNMGLGTYVFSSSANSGQQWVQRLTIWTWPGWSGANGTSASYPYDGANFWSFPNNASAPWGGSY